MNVTDLLQYVRIYCSSSSMSAIKPLALETRSAIRNFYYLLCVHITLAFEIAMKSLTTWYSETLQMSGRSTFYVLHHTTPYWVALDGVKSGGDLRWGRGARVPPDSLVAPPLDSKASLPFWRDFWAPIMFQNANFPGLCPDLGELTALPQTL